MAVTDLNCSSIHIKPDPSFHSLEQRSYVNGQSRLFSSHGTSTVAYLSSLRSMLLGQSQNPLFFLPRSVSMYGISGDWYDEAQATMGTVASSNVRWARTDSDSRWSEHSTPKGMDNFLYRFRKAA